MITSERKLSPAERRLRVALGVRLRKSNRAIAKELGVDEGTVRRDRKFLDTPEHYRPVKKERLRKPKKVKPAYNPDDPASLETHLRRMSKALRLWIAEESMVLDEVEYIVHEAAKRLHFFRDSVRDIPVPTKSPAELIPATRPQKFAADELIPGPDFWTDWLARWLACCLPRQDALHERVLTETSLWARSQ